MAVCVRQGCLRPPWPAAMPAAHLQRNVHTALSVAISSHGFSRVLVGIAAGGRRQHAIRTSGSSCRQHSVERTVPSAPIEAHPDARAPVCRRRGGGGSGWRLWGQCWACLFMAAATCCQLAAWLTLVKALDAGQQVPHSRCKNDLFGAPLQHARDGRLVHSGPAPAPAAAALPTCCPSSVCTTKRSVSVMRLPSSRAARAALPPFGSAGRQRAQNMCGTAARPPHRRLCRAPRAPRRRPECRCCTPPGPGTPRWGSSTPAHTHTGPIEHQSAGAWLLQSRAGCAAAGFACLRLCLRQEGVAIEAVRAQHRVLHVRGFVALLASVKHEHSPPRTRQHERRAQTRRAAACGSVMPAAWVERGVAAAAQSASTPRPAIQAHPR